MLGPKFQLETYPDSDTGYSVEIRSDAWLLNIEGDGRLRVWKRDEYGNIEEPELVITNE